MGAEYKLDSAGRVFLDQDVQEVEHAGENARTNRIHHYAFRGTNREL